MTIEVRRSPAKVCGWVLINGVLLCTKDTRNEAQTEAQRLKRAYL